MKTKILFMGAGAIGRGYLPWALDESRHEYVFIDSNPSVVQQLNARGGYTTYRVNGDVYESKFVKVEQASTPDDFDPGPQGRDRLLSFSGPAQCGPRRPKRWWARPCPDPVRERGPIPWQRPADRRTRLGLLRRARRHHIQYSAPASVGARLAVHHDRERCAVCGRGREGLAWGHA